MVRTGIKAVDYAGVFCPLTRGDCRSDCALLMEYIDMSELNKDDKNPKHVHRDFICALATKENAYYSPSNRIHIREKVEG